MSDNSASPQPDNHTLHESRISSTLAIYIQWGLRTSSLGASLNCPKRSPFEPGAVKNWIHKAKEAHNGATFPTQYTVEGQFDGQELTGGRAYTAAYISTATAFPAS